MKINKQKLEVAMAKECMNTFDLCKATEMKYQMFRRIFNGGNCKPATIGKIAAALGVDVTEFIETERE